MSDTTLEVALRRDRVIVLAAIAGLAAAAWSYTLWLAADMNMGGMDMTGFRMIPAGAGWMMPAAEPWSAVEFVLLFAMWAVMMVGMMTPSAAPMILLYARVGRQAAGQGRPLAATGWFAGGYLAVWAVFSLAATIGQWGLQRAALLTPMMGSESALFGAAVLIAAGLYQWTPFKDACLKHCRAPLHFIQHHGGFRRDAAGSLGIGFRHGLYCIGCCWALMALLFVGGVMNILWIAAIALFVLAEKVLPGGRLLARIAGTGFVAAGIWLMVSPATT
jgi:predicted metal-binding membrane protein